MTLPVYFANLIDLIFSFNCKIILNSGGLLDFF